MLSKHRKHDLYGMAPALSSAFFISLEEAETLLAQWMMNFRDDGQYHMIYATKESLHE
ncbi:hypothetical protein [Pseudotamlana haliotis]|uniref:hypothetical protein n=1 Tax=Pseudotamlana haliotis TaxID=2614804 RepID=UPI00177C8C62|nr:hypothetical protein [Tamlana haliotis]